MNKPSIQIKEMSRKLFKAKAGFKHKNVLHPKRDWMLGIFVGVCITTVITVWSGYTYIANRDGGRVEEEIVVKNPNYQTALVEQALEVFKERATNFDTIVSTTATPAVPIDTETQLDNPIATTSTDESDFAPEGASETQAETDPSEETPVVNQ